MIYILLFLVIILLIAVAFFGGLYFVRSAQLENLDSKELDLLNQQRSFNPKKNFITENEKRLFEELNKALKDKYYIFPQINLSSLLEVKKDIGDRYDKIHILNQFIVDFVIFSKNPIQPVLVIELDDSTHRMNNRQNRDQFIDKALKEAGIKIYHCPSHYLYEHEVNKILKIVA